MNTRGACTSWAAPSMLSSERSNCCDRGRAELFTMDSSLGRSGEEEHERDGDSRCTDSLFCPRGFAGGLMDPSCLAVLVWATIISSCEASARSVCAEGLLAACWTVGGEWRRDPEAHRDAALSGISVGVLDIIG